MTKGRDSLCPLALLLAQEVLEPAIVGLHLLEINEEVLQTPRDASLGRREYLSLCTILVAVWVIGAVIAGIIQAIR